MIVIDKPYVRCCGDKCRLYFSIQKNGKTYDIWFEFDTIYEQYLCTERIDGILVNLLLFCMEHGHDIKSETPVSEKLYYQLSNILIPSISRSISKYKTINIDAPVDNTVIPNEKAVGTGLSGGVDSFYTILKNIGNSTKSFNITHATFFNAGASGSYGGNDARELFKSRLEEMKRIAEELNLPLISVDTNINEFLGQDHEQTHTFRSLAIPLLMQKLFGIYYYSSGFEYSGFRFDVEDTAFYDLLNCTCLSNENMTFYSIGGETNRIEKVRYICKNSVVQNNLNVCVNNATNCSVCPKCKRTILNLYALNELDSFDKLFDLSLFEKNKNKYIAEVLYDKKTNVFSDEIYNMMQKNKIRIPVSSRTYHVGRMFLINLIKKVYKYIKGKLR